MQSDRSTMKIERQGQRGFTLVEMMVVIGILAVLAVIALPSFLSWRQNAQLRGAVYNLRGDMEQAKTRAARENSNVAIEFFSDHYLVFLDNGAGAGADRNNGTREGDEPTLLVRRLPAGVRLDLGHPGFTFSNYVATFGPRGNAKIGTAILVNTMDRRMRLRVENYTGKLSIADV